MPTPRKSPRTPVDADALLRRGGQNKYRVRVYDLSPHGCKIDCVERPRLDERVWVKFEGLEGLEAIVCWAEGHVVGVEFERPMHPAVFELLVSRIRKSH